MTDHFVVDLMGRDRSRMLAQLALAARLPGRRAARPVVLLNAPRGDGVGLQLPGAPLVETPADLVPLEHVAAADDWALAASFCIAEACRPQMQYNGHDVMSLYLCMLQDWLHEYALLALALRTQVQRSRSARLTVLSPDTHLGAALEADLRSAGCDVSRTIACRTGHALHQAADRLWHIPSASTFPTEAGPGPIAAALRGAASPDILLVAESRPMGQMFAACESAMRDRGLSVRNLQFGFASAVAAPPDDRLWALSPADPTYPRQYTQVPPLRLPDVQLPPLPDGTTLSPPWRPRLERRARYRTAAKRRFLDDISAALQAMRPRTVVVGNDRWWIGQAVVQAARQLDIPTIALQDGIMFALPRCWWLAADIGAVNGRHMHDALTAHGVSPDRLAIVGQPRYDQFRTEATRAEARQRLDLPADARVVLVATQPDQAPAYAKAVIATLLSHPDTQVLLRPHPSMDARPLQAIAAAAPNGRVRLDAVTPIDWQMSAADVVVVQNSTVCVEAVLCGVPVITCTLNGLPDLVPYGTLGLATAVRSLPALREALDAVLASSPADDQLRNERRARLEHLIGPMDGRSSERMAALAAHLVTAGRPAC